MPPSCPAGSFYAAAPEDNAAPQTPVRSAASSEDRHGDICHSNSGASSAAANSNGRRRRRRPLALAVGYGDELKDQEGRRVVITPRAARSYGHNSSCTCNTRVPKSPVQREQDISPHQSKVVMCKYCTTNRLREEGLLPCRSGESIGPATSYGK